MISRNIEEVEFCIPEEIVDKQVEKNRVKQDVEIIKSSNSENNYPLLTTKVCINSECEREEKKIESGENNETKDNPKSPKSGISRLPILKKEEINQFKILLELSKKYICLEHIPKYNFPISPSPSKKTILLDLDHTLIISYLEELPDLPSGIPLTFSNSKIPFILRPGAIQFVTQLAEQCEIIIYTSATNQYLIDIFSSIQQFETNISHSLTREDCYMLQEGVFLKSAEIIQNRHISDIIAIDDSFWAYPNHLDNVVPISPFNVELYHSDHELLNTYNFVLSILHLDDVREGIKQKFCLQEKFDAIYSVFIGGKTT